MNILSSRFVYVSILLFSYVDFVKLLQVNVTLAHMPNETGSVGIRVKMRCVFCWSGVGHCKQNAMQDYRADHKMEMVYLVHIHNGILFSRDELMKFTCKYGKPEIIILRCGLDPERQISQIHFHKSKLALNSQKCVFKLMYPQKSGSQQGQLTQVTSYGRNYKRREIEHR